MVRNETLSIHLLNWILASVAKQLHLFRPKWYHFVDTILRYANLWNISFTKDVYWDQLLLCNEPNSCLMHQYLLDNSSHGVLCRFISGYCKKLSTETLITDKFTHPFMSRLLSHPNSFGSFSSTFFFFRENSIIFTPLTNLLSYVLTGFKGEQNLSVRFIEWWPFSVLNVSLLSSNII